jgi:hypothetical protein
VSALTFDPWRLAETQIEKVLAANPDNPANAVAESSYRLAELAGLAAPPSSISASDSGVEIARKCDSLRNRMFRGCLG